MDGREYIALLTHLQLVPDGVSKTFAMDIFTKAKGKGAGKDKSELGPLPCLILTSPSPLVLLAWTRVCDCVLMLCLLASTSALSVAEFQT
jgi:hypothetical protein